MHGPLLIADTLTNSKLVGTLDTSTIDESWSKPPPSQNPQVQLKHEKPPLFSLLSSHDFEAVADHTLSPKAWAFYSSAATDLITAKANKSFLDRIWFRPRILKDVRESDPACKILGVESSLPLFVSPAAMARMVHQSGERGIAAACASKGIIQCVCNSLSVSTNRSRHFSTFVPSGRVYNSGLQNGTDLGSIILGLDECILLH